MNESCKNFKVAPPGLFGLYGMLIATAVVLFLITIIAAFLELEGLLVVCGILFFPVGLVVLFFPYFFSFPRSVLVNGEKGKEYWVRTVNVFRFAKGKVGSVTRSGDSGKLVLVPNQMRIPDLWYTTEKGVWVGQFYYRQFYIFGDIKEVLVSTSFSQARMRMHSGAWHEMFFYRSGQCKEFLAVLRAHGISIVPASNLLGLTR